MDVAELVQSIKMAMAAVVLGDAGLPDPVPTLLVDDRDLEQMARVAVVIVATAFGIDP